MKTFISLIGLLSGLYATQPNAQSLNCGSLPFYECAGLQVIYLNFSDDWIIPADIEAIWSGADQTKNACQMNWERTGSTNPIRGVQCVDNHVTNIDLSSSGLTGNTSDLGYLDDFSMLIELNLFHNNLSGSLPHSIGLLSKLESLNMSFNALEGNIPPGYSNLINLKELRLSNNSLTGQLSSDLENLSHLRILDINTNYLSGNIPEIFSNMTELRDVYLYQNDFTGTIPSSLRFATNLKSLTLNDNQLEGLLPHWMGDLDQLNFLYLNDNQLIGYIPDSFNNLNSLYVLRLNNNFLIGEFPDIMASGLPPNEDTLTIEYNCLQYNSNPAVNDWVNQRTTVFTGLITQQATHTTCNSLYDSIFSSAF